MLQPYQKDRLTSFLAPSADPADAGYQQQQSKIAIGSGEKTGRGVENATQTGLDFLPEHHTDFIFAVVGETYGFAGCALVLFVVRAADMARAPHPDHREEPLRGPAGGRHHRDAAVPALRERRDERGDHAHHRRHRSALSYGGSSLLATFLAIGLLQSVNAQARETAAGKGRATIFE